MDEMGKPTRILFICPELDPDPRSGAAVYILGLARALKRSGAQVGVLATGTTPPDSDLWVQAVTVPPRASMSPARVFTSRPAMMGRFNLQLLERALAALLEQSWDLVCVHHLSGAWAANLLQQARRDHRNVAWIYCSQNDEVEVWRRSIQRHRSRSRVGRTYDLQRVALAQRRMLKKATAVTAISSADAESMSRRSRRDIIVVPPGVPGDCGCWEDSLLARPRSVVIAGSYRWRVKLDNLRELLDAWGWELPRLGVGVVVAGGVADRDLQRLRRTYSEVQFLGEVWDVRAAFQQGRLALVHEPGGGGFKMKVLEYACAGLPIVATEGSLLAGELGGGSVRSVECLASLGQAVIDLIDDEVSLHMLRDAAWAEASGRYSWEVAAHTVLRLRENLG
jgi:glycosyltransferase involved in cell wall biosynthesis